jgi:hypothetical protein
MPWKKNTDRIQFETSFYEDNSIAVEIIFRNKSDCRFLSVVMKNDNFLGLPEQKAEINK